MLAQFEVVGISHSVSFHEDLSDAIESWRDAELEELIDHNGCDLWLFVGTTRTN